MRILVLAPFLYGDKVDNGGAVMCRALLKKLAATHVVGVTAFAHPPDEVAAKEAVEQMKQWAAHVEMVPLRIGFAKKLEAKLSPLRLVPSGEVFMRDPDYAAALRRSLDAFKPDVVLVQFPQMAQYVDQLQGWPTVMDVQDAFSVSGYRYCRQAKGLWGRLNAYLSWLGWVRYESRYYPRFDAVVAVTDQDNAGLKIFNPGLPVVTSKVAFDSPGDFQPSTAPSFDIAFAGSFAHRPNVQAVQHFIDDILPRIRRRVPQARFVVAGRNPPEALTRLASDHVVFPGFVPDVYEFFNQAAVVAIPLLTGGGIKIKTVEAMLSAAAIVSTSIGAEETQALDGRHLFIRDQADGFADAVTELLLHPEKRLPLARDARELALQQFGWPGKLAALDQLFETVRTAHHAN